MTLRRSFNFLILIVMTIPVNLLSQKGKLVRLSEKEPTLYQYVLENGLTVLMSVNKAEPKIYTAMYVNTGAKNDPQDKTGLAHYLEHLLFKGTKNIGTLDYNKEKPWLEQIEQLYEEYNQEQDPEKRLQIYKEIDKISQIAAQYAIPNEYDKLMGILGSEYVNAFTTKDQTVYFNYIPSNTFELWCKTEAERFKNPVISRLFHTELETVFEEKNISLDRDGSYVFELAMRRLFPKHPYGNSVLGTVPHLKKPSIKRIKEFLQTYYVPNNMTLILIGDLDPEKTVKVVEKYFSVLEPKPVPEPQKIQEEPIEKPIIEEVRGKDPEFVSIYFRIPASKENLFMLDVIDQILNNQKTGLIDLNLNKEQKVLNAYAWVYDLQDYHLLVLGARPKQGQSLKEVEKLLLEQIDKLKNGDFDQELILAISKNSKISLQEDLLKNQERFQHIMNALAHQYDWEDYLNQPDKIAKLTKEQIVTFAEENFRNNYVLIRKLQGEREAVKIPKPPITPLKINRDTLSEFAKQILQTPVPKLEPVFPDFSKEIQTVKIRKKIPLYYHENNENDLFHCVFVIDLGNYADKKLGYALEYLKLLGTDKYSPEEIARKFYRMGVSYNLSVTGKETIVSLKGLSENFPQALELLEHLIKNAKPDQETFEKYLNRLLKARKDLKKNKSVILSRAMASYARYGENNPFNFVLNNQELRNLDPKELVKIASSIFDYPHKIRFYGNIPVNSLRKILEEKHSFPRKLRKADFRQFSYVLPEKRKAFFVHYDDMVQAQILWVANLRELDPKEFLQISLFNYYFGADMYSLAFQEIREAKGLAYSTYGLIRRPEFAKERNYFLAFVGTQADKLPEAVATMENLIFNMPRVEPLFNISKESLRKNITAKRFVRQELLSYYFRLQKWNLSEDYRKNLYDKLPEASPDFLYSYYESTIKPLKPVLLILGDKNRLDLKTLEEQLNLKVEELNLNTLFGF